ncbi:MAG: smalltalk protein [Bacteroidaceae bacterium]|nr:smalltalk protein [Bacteroidaceae bacterium]
MNNNENNKTMWGKILHVVITILTAIATTFGVTSCMGL